METKVPAACSIAPWNISPPPWSAFLHIFDPEVLIIGGNIAEAGPQLLAPIRDQVARRTRILLGRDIPIVFQSLVGYGGVAGAAGLVFLQQGLLKI